MAAAPTITLMLQPHGVYYAYAWGHTADTHCLAKRCDPLLCAWWAYRSMRIRSEHARRKRESERPHLPEWFARPVYRWPKQRSLKYLMDDDVFFDWQPEDTTRWWRRRRR